MAFEDWLPFDDAESSTRWGTRCNRCGATDLHWAHGDRWRLFDRAETLHECPRASADEFKIITGENKLKKTTKRKTQKKSHASYFTVGVRFLNGNSNLIYTYKIRRGARVYLGQELIVDIPSGATCVAVVRIDKTAQDSAPGITYKYLTRKAVAL